MYKPLPAAPVRLVATQKFLPGPETPLPEIAVTYALSIWIGVVGSAVSIAAIVVDCRHVPAPGPYATMQLSSAQSAKPFASLSMPSVHSACVVSPGGHIELSVASTT